MKKIIIALLLTLLAVNLSPAQAETIKGIKTSYIILTKEDFKQKTVFKYYVPYIAKLTNTNKQPILLSADTEINFLLDDDSVVKSPTRREIYRRTRKRDIGRYYGLALPGAILAGGITGITFFIGAPIAAGVYIGMYAPTDKAVRSNVKIAQMIYETNRLPLRIEPNNEYEIAFYVPKNMNLKAILIKNAGFSNKQNYDIEIPVKDKL